ncbi:MAG: hypothetical protein RIE58_05540 [Vicingaceae bacterium]
MKGSIKLLTLLFLGLLVNKLIAQDVGISRMVYPEDNQRVHLMFTYDIDLVLVNYGNNAVPYKDITLDLFYDKQFWQKYTIPGTASLASGDSVEVTINAITFATANSTLEICIASSLAGDINPQNDTVCNILTFSLDNYIDLSPVLIRIIDPLINDSLIETSTPVKRMEAYIRNVGNVTLPRGFSILLKFKMYSKDRNFFASTTFAVDTNGLYTIPMLGGLPDVQNKPGPFQVCVTILNLDDQNGNNDEYCQTFYAFDFTGIGDAGDQSSISSFFYGDGLTVNQNGEQKALWISIFNSLGQEVYNTNTVYSTGAEYIGLGHLVPGVHVINIRDINGRVIHSNKFVVE